MKRTLCTLLALVLLLGIVPAMGADVPADFVPMRYVSPGSEWEMQDYVLDLVNKKLAEDGVPIEVELIKIGWDVWDQKSQLMIASGEPFEMIHVMQDLKTAGHLYGQGAIIALDDYINQPKYETLRGAFSERVWNEARANNKLLAVPAYTTAEEGTRYGDIGYRKDVADKLGLSVPTNVDELIDFALKLQAYISEEQGKPVYTWSYKGRVPFWFLRMFDEFRFVDSSLGIVETTQSGQVRSWVETDEFKECCKVYQRLNEAGLIHPDVIVLDHEYPFNECNYGRLALSLGQADINAIPAMETNCPQADYQYFQLNPEKGHFARYLTQNMNAVPVTSPNPEAALDFLQWLYSSKENHDLFIYGVEGVTYTASDPRRSNPIKDASGRNLYEYDTWQIAHIDLRRINESLPQWAVDRYFERFDLDPSVELSVHSGFVFDATPVAAEAANLSAESARVLLPLMYGIVPYEEGYDAMLSTLKAAGLDAYVAEYKRQFDAWYAERQRM